MKHTNARKVKADGYTFASKAEYERYLSLKDMQKYGHIKGLEVHPHFTFEVNGRKVGRGYTADFRYVTGGDFSRFQEVVEDVKGRTFLDWPLRRDLFRACYPSIEFRIIRKTREGFETEVVK